MRFPLFCLVVLMMYNQHLSAQNNNLDSLKAALTKCNTVQCRMDAYANIGAGFYYLSPDSALKYTELGLEVAKSDTSNMDSLYYESYTALLNNAAFINQKKGNYYNAIILYQQSIVAFAKLSDSGGNTSAYLNLARLYNEIGETEAALKSADLFNQKLTTADNVALGSCQILLGEISIQSGEQEEALNHFTSAFSFFNREGAKSQMAQASCKIGQVYFERRDYLTAETYYRDANRFAVESLDAEALSEATFNIATVKRKQGDPDSSIYYGTIALQKAQEVKFPTNIRDAAFLLYEVYSEKGNAEDALKMHVLYKEQDDILRNRDAVKIVTREQLKNDYAVQQAEQEKVKLLQDEDFRRQKIYTWSSVGIGALLLLLFIIAVISYRNKRKSELQITAQNKLLAVKNKEIEDSIVVADRIQRALFPTPERWNRLFPESFIFYRPKDIVSGDFYFTGTYGNYTYIACCDSTGHGVPGAFVSLLNISFINEAISDRKITEPGKILDFVRMRLTERLTDEQTNEGMDGILLRFDSSKPDSVQYSAANNRPLIIRNRSAISLDTNKMPVGKSGLTESPFVTSEFQLEKGDLIVLYTDGFADQFGGPQGKKFKYKALDNLLSDTAHAPCSDIEKSLDDTFTFWKGDIEQTDDVLVIGIRI